MIFFKAEVLPQSSLPINNFFGLLYYYSQVFFNSCSNLAYTKKYFVRNYTPKKKEDNIERRQNSDDVVELWTS
jgi:hypothetical protein